MIVIKDVERSDLHAGDATARVNVAVVEEVIDGRESAPLGTDREVRGPTPTMIGRRVAAWLCVLLAHVLMIYGLLDLQGNARRAPSAESFTSELITLPLEPLPREEVGSEAPALQGSRPQIAAPDIAIDVPADEPAAIAPPARVDWPIEGKKSVARVLAAEAEAERVARMFAGPGGTWASLTKRQRSELKKFRWRPGVDGLEYDEKGNSIYRLPNGCFLVNLSFFGCPIGKAKVHGDMFENMRKYFDEQRLPQTNEGNGTEPEALRPAN